MEYDNGRPTLCIISQPFPPIKLNLLILLTGMCPMSRCNASKINPQLGGRDGQGGCHVAARIRAATLTH